MIKISFTDFWEGFDPNNNIFTNMLKDVFNSDIQITRPRKSDICFCTIYGEEHKRILNIFPEKSILFIGENVRPNNYNNIYSFSCDFNNYSGNNCRFPLWYLEIDWYNTGLGTVKLNEIEKKLIKKRNITLKEIQTRQDCITIFNNKEGTRMEAFKLINKKIKIDGYGRPFNNWFPTYSNYKSKIDKMSNYKFNLCPENSLYPGYYTEKCFHSKLAGCIPIYFADPYVSIDFRTSSFINIYDFLNLNELADYIYSINNNSEELERLINEPLLYEMPSLDKIKEIFKYYCTNILNKKS